MKNIKLQELNIENIREIILFNANEMQKEINEAQKIDIINNLKELLDTIKEMQYNNCSVELFEELVDEELIIDLLIKNDKLDLETAKEICDNREEYLKGTHTKEGAYLLPISIVLLVVAGGTITLHLVAFLIK